MSALSELRQAMSSLNAVMHDRPVNTVTTDDGRVALEGKLYTPWPRYTPPLGVALKQLRAAQDATTPVASDLQVWRARMALVNKTTNLKVRRNCR